MPFILEFIFATILTLALGLLLEVFLTTPFIITLAFSLTTDLTSDLVFLLDVLFVLFTMRLDTPFSLKLESKNLPA